MTTTWTAAARQALERALERVASSLAGSDADPQEVVEDLRRHVEEEIAARGLQVVSEDDIRAILATVGPQSGESSAPTPASAGSPSPASVAEIAAAAPEPPRLSLGAAIWLWPLAVLLPLFALGFELVTHMCAEMLFDPLPTLLHKILVALVPLGNAAGLVALRGRAPVRRSYLLLNGFGLGVALYYALVFAPLTPLSVVMIIAYGIGLLSLAPLLALVAGLVLRRRLRAQAAAGGRTVLAGFSVAILALLLAGLPRAITRYSLHQAAQGGPADRLAAVQRLRTFGNREILLRACYERSGELGDLESYLLGTQEVEPAEARAVYYRVTGEPFNSVPPPKLAGGGDWMRGVGTDDQGGPAVGGVTPGLTLAASRIDGSLDPSAALGYLEWTLEFHNSSATLAEARGVLALPPGSVVSRATLWIAGEEHEAAFGGRDRTRAAYEQRVRVQHDPLLVTTAGPDRVLVQSFPVPAGGSQKIRIGITAPLPIEQSTAARLYLPHVVERNFRIDGATGVWIESKGALEGPGLRAERTPAGAAALRGDLAEDRLATTSIVVRRDPEALATWTRDPVDGQFEVEQSLEALPAPAHGTDVVVLDGSQGMAEVADDLRQALAAAGGPSPIVLLAGDEVEEIQPGDLRSDRFRGGMDSLPALVAAWDRTRGRVLWVHAAQPALLSSVGPLEERCDRRPDGPALVSLAIAPGPDHVLDDLDGCAWLRVAPRRGTLAEDLRALLAGGSPDGATWRARRERVAAGAHATEARETSAHLARLWAWDQIRARPAAGQPDALDLAVRYRLVTPKSGAVVLATEQELTAAGLDPGVPPGIPTVPEPATLALVAVAAIALLVATRLLPARRIP